MSTQNGSVTATSAGRSSSLHIDGVYSPSKDGDGDVGKASGLLEAPFEGNWVEAQLEGPTEFKGSAPHAAPAAPSLQQTRNAVSAYNWKRNIQRRADSTVTDASGKVWHSSSSSTGTNVVRHVACLTVVFGVESSVEKPGRFMVISDKSNTSIALARDPELLSALAVAAAVYRRITDEDTVPVGADAFMLGSLFDANMDNKAFRADLLSSVNVSTLLRK